MEELTIEYLKDFGYQYDEVRDAGRLGRVIGYMQEKILMLTNRLELPINVSNQLAMIYAKSFILDVNGFEMYSSGDEIVPKIKSISEGDTKSEFVVSLSGKEVFISDINKSLRADVNILVASTRRLSW